MAKRLQLLLFFLIVSFSFCCDCPDLETMVTEYEGRKNCVYLDIYHHPTIGIGFNLDRDDAKLTCDKFAINYDEIRSGKVCLTDKQINDIFHNDLKLSINGASNCIPSFEDQPNCIQNVLVDMSFNMGERSLCKWGDFITQLANKEYEKVADNMKNSKWCRQAGYRCRKNIAIVKSC